MATTVDRLDRGPTGRRRDSEPLAGRTVLSLLGIVKRWIPGRPAVLDGLDLEIAAGTTVGIAGANGAGKTTLLRIAAGLICADEGEIRLCGLDPERDPTGYHRHLGFAAAGNTGLYARLKVEHHLELWARLALVPRPRRIGAIERVSQSFSLDELMGLRVDRLSMGQRQRLRLAMAFLHDPTVVLLDEPLTSLDGEGISQLAAAIDDLKRRGGAAVVCMPTLPSDLHTDMRHVVHGGRLVRQ